MFNRVPVTPDAAQSTLQHWLHDHVDILVGLRNHSSASF